MSSNARKEKATTKSLASAADLNECKQLHRQYGTTYFFASQLFPPEIRQKTHALYGFVRLPDEWVDNPSEDLNRCRRRIEEYRTQLEEGLDGKTPGLGVLRAFCDVVNECQIPIREPLLFIDAMIQDLSVDRYSTYQDLQGYMRGSASAVGVMMSYILSEKLDPACLPYAMALGEAMQMTNFLRDVGEDMRRGRIYIPLEDLARFGLDEQHILDEQVCDSFRALMKFEIARTRDLYRFAEKGIAYLPPRCGKAVKLASVLYGRILNRIEACNFEIFQTRARTSKTEKFVVAAQILSGLA